MKLKFCFIFLITIVIAATILHYEKEKKIEKYIFNKTKEHQAMYDAIYHSFKKRADMASAILLSDSNIISIYEKLQNADSSQKDQLRKEFQKQIEEHYKVLESQGIYILHFHLKNNDSFYRMHKPEKYGDNLSDTRKTIVYTNSYKKPIDGFEVGKYFSGYRFIYPLKNSNYEHLGSLEISFDLSLYVKEFMNTLDVLSNFRIKKEIVEEKCDKVEIVQCYSDSNIVDYYAPKNISKVLDMVKVERLKKLVVDIKTVQKGIDATNNGDAISVFDNKSKNLITFIPVKNPVSQRVCGFITIRSDDMYIYNKTINSYFILGLFSIFVFLGLLFIYRELKSQKEINNLLQKEVDKKTKQLQDINENLELKVKNEVDKNLQHEIKLFEQSKLAAMGDMIGNIAHQWRQPLSIMSMIASTIKMKQQFGILDQKTISEGMEDIVIRTKYLSETIETFRNYLKEEKETKEVVLQERIQMAIAISKTVLEDHHIELIQNLDTIEPIHIKLVAGELTEVLINLINNAKDVLVEKNITKPWVKLSLEKEKSKVIITIEDNGGGVPEKILPKIFEQYFTTKDASKGTGLGLHMSKKIIEESIKGHLCVKNTYNGAKFFIELPLEQ